MNKENVNKHSRIRDIYLLFIYATGILVGSAFAEYDGWLSTLIILISGAGLFAGLCLGVDKTIREQFKK